MSFNQKNASFLEELAEVEAGLEIDKKIYQVCWYVFWLGMAVALTTSLMIFIMDFDPNWPEDARNLFTWPLWASLPLVEGPGIWLIYLLFYIPKQECRIAELRKEYNRIMFGNKNKKKLKPRQDDATLDFISKD